MYLTHDEKNTKEYAILEDALATGLPVYMLVDEHAASVSVDAYKTTKSDLFI